MTSALIDKTSNNSLIQNRLPLFLFGVLILVFCAIKFQDLQQPYFWDELGVYPKAAHELTDKGLSLMPASVDPEYSRGHPLLFAFIIATGFTLFGKSVVVGHAVALLISLALLISIYYVLSKEFNEWVGLSVALLVSMQSIFLAQSSMVLPEVMVALTCWWSIYYLSKDRLVLFGLWGALAILTKESAIVLVPAGITWLLYQRIVFKQKVLTLGRFFWVLLPLIVFGIFLIIQRIQNGWFLFPYHTDVMELTIDGMVRHLTGYVKVLTMQQHRVVISVAFVIGLVVLLVKRNTAIFKNPFIICSVIFLLGFLAFSMMNFYISRYILVLFPLYFAVAMVLWYYIFPDKTFVIFPFVLGAALYSIIDAKLDIFEADNNMAYVYLNEVQTETLEHLETLNAANDSITANFPMCFALTDSFNGFEKRAPYKNTITYYDKRVKWLVFVTPPDFNIGPDLETEFYLVKHFNKRYANGFIYRRKQ